MHGNSIGLLVVLAVPSVVHEILLTLSSAASTGCNYDSCPWNVNCVKQGYLQ